MIKLFQLVRAIVITAALFAAATSSLAQAPSETAAAVARSPLHGRALTDYAPVLKSALDRAWAVAPERGIETREVADGVFVVTDGVWQSAFVVTDAGVDVFAEDHVRTALICARWDD